MNTNNNNMIITDLEGEKALEYFMQPDCYCTLNLPPYIDFKPLLERMKDKVKYKNWKEILKENGNYPSRYDGVNYKLLMNKDGKYSFRPLEIANPVLYYVLAKTITTEENWAIIKENFAEYKHSDIEVSSIPQIKKQNDKTQTGASILNWWENFEQRIIELSLEYKYMFSTDIANCYSSIYTHSIEWAIIGKKQAKQNMIDNIKENNIGKQIDDMIRNMQYGQTNGIPQGSVLFDFIAELVLSYADNELFLKLKEQAISDYKILRYRDDYRIFSNSREDIDKIVLVLQRVLAELNFQMNSSKTNITEQIVENAIKPDKFYYIANIPGYNKSNNLFNSLQAELFYILSISKKFPNSGVLMKALNNLSKRIENEENEEIKAEESHSENSEKTKTFRKKHDNVTVLVAILVEIAIYSPKAYQLVLSIISYLINSLDDENEKETLIKNVKNKLQSLSNTGHIQIWLQRITYKIEENQKIEYQKDINALLEEGNTLCHKIILKLEKPVCPYEESLCKLIYGENIDIWNFDWLKDDIKNSILSKIIFNKEKLEKLPPYIKTEEISVFNQYV